MLDVLAQFLESIWQPLLALLLALLLGVAGCTPDSEPIERAANRAVDEVIKPLMEKGISELSTRTAQFQGQLSAINPGYVVEGHGIFGTGLVYQLKIRTDGVSGNIAGAGQLDQGEALPDTRPPGERTPPTEPAAETPEERNPTGG